MKRLVILTLFLFTACMDRPDSLKAEKEPEAPKVETFTEIHYRDGSIVRLDFIKKSGVCLAIVENSYGHIAITLIPASEIVFSPCK